MSGKFTAYLLDKYSQDFKKATTSPFLVAAGDGTISQEVLREWLKQDYLYAYVGYIKFASALMAKLPLSTSIAVSAPALGPVSDEATNISRILSTLSFSLSNAARETAFFVSTAKEHGLDLFSDPASASAEDTEDSLLGEYNPITRAYTDFLHAIGGLGGIEEGLVLLWTMEKAYLEAWLYAKTHRPATPASDPSEKEKALRKFIDNWTCEEFVGFVNDCEEIVDGLNLELGSDAAKRAEEVFKRTLWLEQRFWPSLEA